jgi:hypothetical protein
MVDPFASGDANDAEIATIVEVADDVTSQSRHSLILRGSPPAAKPLIPFVRRDVRVVEGARLESEAASSTDALQRVKRARDQRLNRPKRSLGVRP